MRKILCFGCVTKVPYDLELQDRSDFETWLRVLPNLGLSSEFLTNERCVLCNCEWNWYSICVKIWTFLLLCKSLLGLHERGMQFSR